jgi:23S rRNA (cytidine1920-2'-O)/16S rRNA (cytidine1409-2'-O)-methyltransferase
MEKQRLDQALVVRGLVVSRSQAESWIRLGKVFVDGKNVQKPGVFVHHDAGIELRNTEQYVSRAGLKLASVAAKLDLDFRSKIVLDVGSSTGGFSDYALQHGAKMVIAVDVGTNQLHSSLRDNPKIELHEKTDIRDFAQGRTLRKIDIVVIDVSFISLREILPYVATLSGGKTAIVAMLKPQFEAGSRDKHKGVIKNNAMRREILKNFERWAKNSFIMLDKADSQVAGMHGNQERFYKLQKIQR